MYTDDEHAYSVEGSLHFGIDDSEYGFCDTDSMSDTNTVNSKKKISKYSKNVEKGFYKVEVQHKGKIFKIGFFETKYTPGTLVRNAVSGNRFEDIIVGKPSEDLFFKVCNTTIENGTRTPIIMYFDSPEQFEKHFKCTVSDANKEKWRAKNNIALRLRNDLNDRKYGMKQLNPELVNTVVK